jgi:hypothetical protein
VVVRSTSLPDVVDDFCFDSLRRLLAAASSRVEQADGGLGHDCPIPPDAEASHWLPRGRRCRSQYGRAIPRAAGVSCDLLRRVMGLRLGWATRFLPVAVVVVMVAFGGLLGIDGAGAASGSGAARVSYEVPQFAPIGARTVWAVTLAGSMNHPSQRVLRSVDGGARWSDVTPPGAASGGDGDIALLG